MRRTSTSIAVAAILAVSSTLIATHFAGVLMATCSTGKKVLGGDAFFLNAAGGAVSTSTATILTMGPAADGGAWEASVFMSVNPDLRITSLEVRATCAMTAS